MLSPFPLFSERRKLGSGVGVYRHGLSLRRDILLIFIAHIGAISFMAGACDGGFAHFLPCYCLSSSFLFTFLFTFSSLRIAAGTSTSPSSASSAVSTIPPSAPRILPLTLAPLVRSSAGRASAKTTGNTASLTPLASLARRCLFLCLSRDNRLLILKLLSSKSVVEMVTAPLPMILAPLPQSVAMVLSSALMVSVAPRASLTTVRLLAVMATSIVVPPSYHDTMMIGCLPDDKPVHCGDGTCAASLAECNQVCTNATYPTKCWYGCTNVSCTQVLLDFI